MPLAVQLIPVTINDISRLSLSLSFVCTQAQSHGRAHTQAHEGHLHSEHTFAFVLHFMSGYKFSWLRRVKSDIHSLTLHQNRCD